MKINNRISLLILTLSVIGCTTELTDYTQAPGQEVITSSESAIIDGVAKVFLSEELAEMLESSLSEGGIHTKSEEVNSIFEELGVTSVQRLFPYAGEYEPRVRREGLHRWYKVHYSLETTVTKAERSLLDIPGVEIFEPERRIRSCSVFNDPKLRQQWHYFNDGSISSAFSAGCDINVTSVWENFTTGDRSVLVAVIDSGVDYEHEDLAASYVGGQNFGTGGKVTPDDHGTHVAGTIAAVNNNGIGVSGIAGGNAEKGIKGVGILACQIFSGNNPVGSAEAITWAADNGAVIANNSWGYVFDTEEDAKKSSIESSSLKAAIDYFIKYAGCDNDGNQLPDSPMKGGVILFSSGNDGWRYNPIGEYEPVIAVGSVGPDYTRAYYSNYGDWVDIAAPGGNARIDNGMVYSTIVDGKYGFMQGTSMSCPHASGVAALIASYFGGSGFTNDMLVERLIGGARYDVLPASAGSGPLIDALGSFTMGGTIAPEKVEEFDIDVIGNRITLNVKITEDKDDKKPFEYIVLMSENRASLEGVDVLDIPTDVKQYHFRVSSVEVGDYMTIEIPDLEFDREYHITIIGCDYSQNYSDQSDIKSIKTKQNNAPVITALQNTDNIRIKSFETVKLSFEIYDPEGGALNVGLKEGWGGLSLQKTISGSWEITITGSISKPGTYDCTIVATDAHMLSSEYSFDYQILENHTPVLLKAFDDLFVEGTGKTFSYNLSDYFSDSDGESLTYKVTASSKTIEAEVSDGKLSIKTKGYGSATVTVTASDAKGATCSSVMRVMVKDADNLVEMYPIPVTDVLNIRTGEEKETDIVIKSASGDVVHEIKGPVSAFDPAVIDMKHCAPGRYIVTVTIGTDTTEKVITKI